MPLTKDHEAMGGATKVILVFFALICLMLPACGCCSTEPAGAWKNDIEHQVLSARPRLEARYTSAQRNGFDINADQYRALIDLESKSGQKVRSLAINGPMGGVNILGEKGIYFQLTDSKGTTYSSLNSLAPSRVNIYRRGPYYIETHWLDVVLTDSAGAAAPIKGEVVFYSYPEKTHVGVILHATDDLEVKKAAVIFDLDAENCSSKADTDSSEGVHLNDFCLISRADNAPTCALIYPVPRGVDEVSIEKAEKGLSVTNSIYSDEAHGSNAAKWQKGQKYCAYLEIYPLPTGDVTPEMEAELVPLMSTNFTAESGKTLGYDPIRGSYAVQTDNPGDFNYHYYVNQNAYETAAFSVQNNDLARKIYIMHETKEHPGTVEGGVVLDSAGNTLPVTVQISKNFCCEYEEPFYNPTDIPFSETLFPLYLEPSETRKLTSLHLYQNWGVHPLKQVSSLAAWMDYLHMSTGVTETTCSVPFLFGGLDGVNIADLRPMSQKMWKSQPQHDNVAGHSFLRYQDSKGAWHFVEYTGATFRSTGPNWADMSMTYLSDDGKAKMTLDIFELPQTDETRNFMHIRVDFTDDISIKDDDLARNVRLLNISSWVQRMRYTNLAYGGPRDEPKIVPIKLNDDFTVAGEPLPEANGYATVYPDERGADAYVVRNFEGKIGGKPVGAGVSLIGQKNGDTILMLVPVTKAKSISAGDYVDMDLFILPYGGVTEDEKPAKKAAYDFGAKAPKLTNVTVGKKIADFPTRVALDDKGKAEFSVTGGINCIPIIVEGAKNYSSLRLYDVDSGKKLIEHSRKGEKDGYQVFPKDDGTFGYVFLVNTDGNEHKYLAE